VEFLVALCPVLKQEPKKDIMSVQAALDAKPKMVRRVPAHPCPPSLSAVLRQLSPAHILLLLLALSSLRAKVADFLRYKDHTLLPKHPAQTGRTDQCWACGKDADPEKCIFNMRVTPRIPDPRHPEPVKVCIFCSNDCWMGGWPLVRHRYVLAGGDPPYEPKKKEGEEAAPAPEAAPASESA
jgi:hypothetical protein